MKAALLVLLLNSFAFAEISLEEAAGLMFQHSPVMAQTLLEAQIAGKERLAVRSAYLPRLDFTQSWTRSDNPVFVFGTLLNQRNFTAANFDLDSLNHPSALSNHTSTLRASGLLYDFGGREAKMKSADARYQISTLQQQAAKNRMLLELVKRYYGLSIAQQNLITATENFKNAQSRWEQAKDRVEQQIAVKTEQLSAEVFRARKKQELLDAENNLKLSRAAFKELLGVENLPDFQTSPLSQETRFPERDLHSWKDQMILNRPELKIAAEGVQLASAQNQSSRAAFFPSLEAWSQYEWHGESLQYTGNNWGAGVQLRWNLFHGFSDAAQHSQAVLQEQAAKEKLRETENSLLLQLESAYYRFQNSKEKVLVASAAREEAEENRRIHADRYCAGLVTIQDSLQAEAARAESESLYLGNLYELQVAHAELLISAGLAQEIVKGER